MCVCVCVCVWGGGVGDVPSPFNATKVEVIWEIEFAEWKRWGRTASQMCLSSHKERERSGVEAVWRVQPVKFAL